ncbi:MAG: hypothetical protein JSS06_04685, partial [Proteobacteria bacterium]|nr:hypothetical protein [Pseudomonadota bacterium]
MNENAFMTENLLSPSEVKDILLLIEDGFLFERFAQEFLAARLGYKLADSTLKCNFCKEVYRQAAV